MKLNRLETHDRFQHLIKDQAINVSQGVEDCLRKNPFSLALQEHSSYIYIFAHPRTAEDGVNKRMLYQPRLTKPQAQTNSYLFRAESKKDILEICWMIPPKEMWKQYSKGNVTEQETVIWSIDMYKNHRMELEKDEENDLSDDQVKVIYTKIANDKKAKDLMIDSFKGRTLQIIKP